MADTQPSSPSRPSCRSLEGRVSFSTIADGSRLDQISGVHAADLAVSDSIAMRNWHFEKSQIVFSRFDPHFDRPPEVLVFHWPLSQLAIAVRCYRRRGIGSSGCQQVACTAICFCMLLHTAVAIDPSLSIELKMWRYTAGVYNGLKYTLLPGRLLGGDWYNPFTNTTHIYSDLAPVAIARTA